MIDANHDNNFIPVDYDPITYTGDPQSSDAKIKEAREYMSSFEWYPRPDLIRNFLGKKYYDN